MAEFPNEQQGFGPINQPHTLGTGNTFPALTKGDVSLPATPKLSVFAKGEKHGVHGYALSQDDLDKITEQLYLNPIDGWDEAYWPTVGIGIETIKSWWLGKYNPIEAILDCFFLPDFFFETSTQTSSSNPEGYPTKLRGTNYNRIWLNSIKFPLEVNSTNQYTSLSTHFYWKRFGTLNIGEYFKSFLDYAPYTRIQVYLPFIGIQEIPVNLCMNGSIELDYLINAFNGNCTAFLTLKDRNNNSRLVNTATGNCAVHVPITSYIDTTIANMAGSAVTAAVMIGGTAVASSAGMTTASSAVAAAEGAAENAQRVANSYQEMFGSVPANHVSALSQAQASLGQARSTYQAMGTQRGLALSSSISQGISSVGGALSTPQSTAMCGNVAGDMSIMSQLTPYVLILRPTPCTPYNYNHLFGRTSNITGKIKQFTNFNQFGAVNVSIKDASDAERAEIKSILTAGVILPEYER